MRRMEMKKVETRDESTMEYAHAWSATAADAAAAVISIGKELSCCRISVFHESTVMLC